MKEWSSVIIAFIALAISIVGINLSYDANQTANRTQELQTRPWLIPTVQKDDSTSRYINIIEINDSSKWMIRINIENKGSTPANNIRIGVSKQVMFFDDTYLDTNLVPHPNVTVLDQGSKIQQKIIYNGRYKELYKKITQLKEVVDKNMGFMIRITVDYTGLINEQKKYKSDVVFQIRADEFYFIKNSKYR